MKRWDHVRAYDSELYEAPDGDWVLYADAQSELKRLTTEVERLRWLCHSYFQSHCGTEAEDDNCLDLYREGVFFDGELRERVVINKTVPHSEHYQLCPTNQSKED